MTSDDPRELTPEAVESRIMEFIQVELLGQGETITPEDNLLSGEIIDSIGVLRLSTFVNPIMNEQILRLFCLNGVDDLGLIRDIVAVVRPIDRATVSSRLNAMVALDAAPHLAAVQCPVLVLSATRDRVVRRRFSESLLAAIPDVAHREVEGPHLLLQAAPAECAAAINAFVATRCATAADQSPVDA